MLAGASVPFRCGEWSDLTARQKEESLRLGRDFWAEPLRAPALRLVVACGREAEKLVVDLTAAKLAVTEPLHWGTINVRAYRYTDGKTILALPHLSHYKVFVADARKITPKQIKRLDAIRDTLNACGWSS